MDEAESLGEGLQYRGAEEETVICLLLGELC